MRIPASVSDQTTTRRGRQRTDCDCLILVNSPGEIRTLQRRPGIILRICCRPRSEDASGRRPISIERTVGGSTSPWSRTSETGTQTSSTTFMMPNVLGESTSIPPQRPPGLSTGIVAGGSIFPFQSHSLISECLSSLRAVLQIVGEDWSSIGS